MASPMIRKFFSDLGTVLNSTNMISFRIWVTSGCIVLTAVQYTVVQPYLGNVTWQPSWEWLVFLLAAAGVDTTAFHLKRMTHVGEDGHVVAQKIKKGHTPTPAPATPPTAVEEGSSDEGLYTTDISELYETEKG